MRKALIIFGKSLLALLSLAGVALLWFTGWLIWHYEYGLGFPNEAQLAALSSTGPVCTAATQQTYVPLAEIPPLLRNAAIAYEQPDFYEVWSLNPFAHLAFGGGNPHRAQHILHSVTHCLISLAPGCCRGLDWNIGAVFFMQRMANTLSRDRILEIYLNESYRGRGAYGVAAAAEAYFGKPLSNLDIDEVAFITSRARLPNTSRRSFETSVRDSVIDRMQTAGLVSAMQATTAKSRPLLLKDIPGGHAKPVNQ
ncbi:transglycosylase domain-containing protein [Bradyrhizobium sp. SRL28]|uniref:transglycosylase domain-containing protein n=1 Tax=Bradyrhizobium sp. SRL28 TaxID=2836178 RepID=UPI001BDDDD37|nr:transglycosylase domain-containing protein [Bradyrhizobium sp. SRL28]MBT1508914.1 transglycosylase domain-containing protein [Bradyrhizobium sp. SRL28]